MTPIVKMVFGSHLYGLDTPESDKDFKGVYLPDINDILLLKVQNSISTSTGNDRSKNTKDDVDTEIFSLQYFMNMLAQGQTIALDMVHAPDWAIEVSSEIWMHIVSCKHKFYTKNMTAFISYCRKQANKYGIKGSRLDEAIKVEMFLSLRPNDMRLSSIWNHLPDGEHIHKLPPSDTDMSNRRIYQVVGKQFLEHARLSEVRGSLQQFIANAGDRAAKARMNRGIDWKAVSHAVRAADQMKQLFTEGTITFPLKRAEYIKSVKMGRLDYTRLVAPDLERTMDEVEELASVSGLPDTVDYKWLDDFTVSLIRTKYNLQFYP